MSEVRRALALLIGAYALGSALAPLLCGHATSILWWGDLRPLPPAVALSTVALAGAIALRWGARPRPRIGVLAGTAAALFVAIPLAVQLAGRVDQREACDAVVVFGARVYADGRCSPALADRVRTAVRLHRAGLVRVLLMSGGPGDGRFHETDGMRILAVKMGVPPAAILCDTGGVNTRATVRNTVAMLRAAGHTRVMTVTHAYHLPRAKSCYASAGLDVRGVPAEESYLLTQMPWLMTRETGSLWAHWARTLTFTAP